MEQVTKVELSPDLLPAEIPAIQAQDGNYVSKLQPLECDNNMFLIIQTAYMILNQEQDEKMIALMAQELTSDLQLKYRFLTVEEVRLAIRMGAKEELGVIKMFPALSLFNFISWIKSYIALVRDPAIHKQNKHAEKLVDKTDSGRRIEWTKHLQADIIKVYEKYCQGQEIIDDNTGKIVYEPCRIEDILFWTVAPHNLIGTYYDHLNKNGLIDIEDFEKHQIYNAAELRIDSEIPQKSEKKMYAEFFGNRNGQIMDLAKSMAVTEMFNRWKKDNYQIVFKPIV